MNLQPIELILNSLALTSVVALLSPKILFHISLRRLNKSTVGHLGATAYKPKHMVSRQPLALAAQSVRKALTRKKYDLGWIVREHHGKNSHSPALHIEGYVPAAKIAELSQSQEKNNEAALDIKIRVDLYERAEGTEIVWKYLPNNPSDSQERKELLDPRFNHLLSHTNSQLLTLLNPEMVKV